MNDVTRLSEVIPSPQTAILRALECALDRAVEEWNNISPLSSGLSTDFFIRQVLRFIDTFSEETKTSKENASLIQYKCFRWIPEKPREIPQENSPLINIYLENETQNRLDIFPNTHEFGTLKTGKIYCDDKVLIMRAWLPYLDKNEEVILLFRFEAVNDILLTREDGGFIERKYETLLSGVRLAIYQAEKSKFMSGINRKIPDRELLKSCERLLYQELWRICWKKSTKKKKTCLTQEKIYQQHDTSIFLNDWQNLGNKPVLMDDEDHDFILSSYLNCLIYLINQDHDDQEIKNKLSETFQKCKKGKKILLHISRGPAIEVGKKMKRTRCAVALGWMLFNEIENNSLICLIEELKKNGLEGSVQISQLKPIFSVIQNNCEKILQKRKFTDADGKELINLLRDAKDTAKRVKPLLQVSMCHFEGDDTTNLNKETKDETKEKAIELSSRWLDAWFGLRLLDSHVLPDEGNISQYEPMRVAELVKYWACYFQYLLEYFVVRQLPAKNNSELNELPTEPASNAVEKSQLTLICEWTHEQGVPRSIPLQAWLEKTHETELALYALGGKGRHRQHIFHVQNTCLLGCAMLFSHWNDDQNEIKKTYLEYLSEISFIPPEDLLCNWLVASLMHDIGYVLQVIPHSLEALSKGVEKGLEELVKDIDQRLKMHSPDITDYDPNPSRASAKLMVSDHAHVSMAAVHTRLQSFNDHGQTATRYNPALAAIIDHGSNDTPVDYATDPLSALIILCDELQDWGRIRLDTKALAENFLTSLHIAPGENLDPVILEKLFVSSRLYVSVLDLDKECNIIHPKENGVRAMHFMIQGSYAGEGGYEPAIAWLDVCRSFQRIKSSSIENLPEIHVVMQHSVKDGNEQELYRLSRFAHREVEQRGAILDWLTLVRKKGSDCYGYSEKPHSNFPFISSNGTDNSFEWIEYCIPYLYHDGDCPLKSMPEKLYKNYRELREVEKIKI